MKSADVSLRRCNSIFSISVSVKPATCPQEFFPNFDTIKKRATSELEKFFKKKINRKTKVKSFMLEIKKE